MYKVSEAYKKASLKSSRESRVEGFIELSDKVTIAFDSTDVLNGSLSIDNAAVSGQELNLGTVYTGKMQITIKLNLDRYQLYDKKIGLTYYLKVGDNWEEVPLGEYYISEAKRNGKYIAISAYDDMLKFDEDLSEITSGKPYSLISQCCKDCGVEMEQLEEEIDALSPFEIVKVKENGVEVDQKQCLKYGLPSDNSISTYRALLSELAIVLGGFFIIGRTGKLKFMRFGNDTGVVIKDAIRKSAEIYDYQCEYSGLKTILDNEDYIVGNSDKIVLDIGNLGILKNGLIETKQKTVEFIYNQIKDLNYTPGSITYIGDPALDLGDIVTIDGYDADPDGTKMLITAYNWNFHGNHKLQAVGKNIKIASSKKQTTQQIQNITQNVKQEAMTKILTYYNAEAFNIGATPYQVARIMVPVSEKTSILVTGQIIMNVTTPGTVKVTYRLNDEIKTFTPQQIMPVEGYYLLNLMYRLHDITESSQNIFEVYIQSEDGEAFVDVESCMINLTGSGIVQSNSWDGILSFKEGITALYLGTVNPNIQYIDSLKTSLHSYVSRGFSEVCGPMYLGPKGRYQDTCSVTRYDKSPTGFSESYKKLQFSFGGLNVSDEIEISVEEPTEE